MSKKSPLDMSVMDFINASAEEQLAAATGYMHSQINERFYGRGIANVSFTERMQDSKTKRLEKHIRQQARFEQYHAASIENLRLQPEVLTYQLVILSEYENLRPGTEQFAACSLRYNILVGIYTAYTDILNKNGIKREELEVEIKEQAEIMDSLKKDLSNGIKTPESINKLEQYDRRLGILQALCNIKEGNMYYLWEPEDRVSPIVENKKFKETNKQYDLAVNI